MKQFKCLNECCVIKFKPYSYKHYKSRKVSKKAGAFIYDSKRNKVLLVDRKSVV